MKTQRNTISVTWEVDDGYCGGAAPQYTQINMGDILACDTVDEAMNLVEEEIESDFRNHANPTYNSDKIRKQIEELFKTKDDESL